MPYRKTLATRRRRPIRAKKTTFKKKGYARGLARFAYSRKRLASGISMSNMLNTIAETKLLALNRQQQQSPAEINSGSKAFYKAFVVGAKPGSWTGTYNALGGVTIMKGVDSNQREGNYVFMQKTHISLNIDTSYQSSGYRPPMEFRVICAKLKRGTSPTGYTLDPSVSLFLNEGGTHFGHSSSGCDGTDIMLQPLNKRDYFIKSDRRFTLSIPVGTKTDPGGYSGHYAVKKNLFYNLGFYKKTRFEDSGGLQNVPYDLDTAYFIIVYARSVDKAQSANDWEVNLRGTTSFKDI